jgi:hypothetical protein
LARRKEFLSHPLDTLEDMNEVRRINAMQFASMARVVAEESRARGLKVPGFRTPPHAIGVSRSLQRLPGGDALVAVAIRGREDAEVYGDLVDGVIAVNGLRGGLAKSMHRTLLRSVLASAPQAA